MLEFRKASVGCTIVKEAAKPPHVSTSRSVRKINDIRKISVIDGTYSDQSMGRIKTKVPEADTVAHCGESLSDMFVYTRDTVDIATGWTDVSTRKNSSKI